MRLLSIIAWLAALCLATLNVAHAEDSDRGYQLGRGVAVGDTGIHFGGYAGIHLEGFGALPWSLHLNDFSLFTTWDNGSNLRFFAETEVEAALALEERLGFTTRQAAFRLERLYVDYLLTHHVTIRLGKLLTPIGQWNVMHADPLVWTTTRPVVTENLFAEHLTGIMAHGSFAVAGQAMDYAVYADNSTTLDPKTNDGPNFDHALGGRIRYNLHENLKIGVSYADFALQNSLHIRNHLLGFDLAWTYQGYAINSEILYRNNNQPDNNHAWQGYIQGVSPLVKSLYAVGRYEFFDQANDATGQVGVLGLAYRPQPALIWKLEYSQGVHNSHLAPNGLYCSFSVLF